MGHNQHHTVHDDAWMMIKHCSHDNPAQHDSILTGLYPYILKAGFAGFQNPQKIWIFLQKDCLRTRKVSILQQVSDKGEEASSKTKVCRKVLHNMSHNMHTSRFALKFNVQMMHFSDF